MAYWCSLRVALAAVFLLAAAGAFAAPHIVVDLANGKVIDREDEFDRWYPASLTKLMTAYTVFKEVERGAITLRSPVKVSARALAQPPSKMGFPVGTVLNFDTALQILMVKSANDISVAVAESAAGSETEFVRKMNMYAKELGMRDSSFANPHGLFHKNQYTTARDMALLALALRREFPQHAHYFSIPAIRHGKKTLQNHNALLQRFRGTTGMKTGYICESGMNIVATAKRGQRELLAVVLGGPSGRERNVRAAALLAEGFSTPGLGKPELSDLQPGPLARRTPANMRGEICSGKRKKVETPRTASLFALKKPSLDDLEKRYLSPKGHDGRVFPIVLGKATGPDPFGLLDGPQNVAPMAFAEESQTDVPWPAVFGKPRVKVPVPTPRPR